MIGPETPPARMDKRTVVYLCIFGFVLRSLYILFVNPDISFPDEKRFWQEATSLLNGEGIQAGGKFAHDMPLTAIFIAFTSLLTGGSVVGVKLFIAALSAATIYLIAKLAFLISGDRQASLIAAAIASVYPFFIFYSSLILSENLFMLLLVLFFLQIMNHKASVQRLAGLTAGLAHLVRPTLLYFLPVAFAWQYFIKKCSLITVMVAAVLLVMVILPWGVRNAIVLNDFHLSTSGSGQVLWEGNNPWNDTGGVSGSFDNPHAYLEGLPQTLDELQQDDWKQQKAIRYITQNPDRFLRLSIQKLKRFWNLWPNAPDYQSWKYKVASLASFGVVLFFAICSVYVFRREFKRLSIIYLFIVYYTMLHMVTIGSIRYRLPLEPLLIALASGAITRMFFLDTDRLANIIISPFKKNR